jgi:nitrite reductase (NADH) large subunit
MALDSSHQITLLVVGNGMVSAHFCRRLVELGALKKRKVIVIGREPRPAYDRVHLSEFARTGDASALELFSRGWYAENGIQLITGDPATRLDLEKREVMTESGETVQFDDLVIVTGSKPFVPPIPGAALAGVHVYRTVEDMEAICAGAKDAQNAIVIGGGLLGIEAAQALQHLKVKDVSIVEAAAFLMPQQLSAEAGQTLQTHIEAQNIRVQTAVRIKEIAITKTGLNLVFEDETTLPADLIIIATGVRPFTDWLPEDLLQRGRVNAIQVNDQLETSEPGIYAIGECAEHSTRIYGLVAPGYEMADVLAKRMAGKTNATFKGADTSTRLKMLGTDVVTFRDALQPGRSVVFKADGIYRKLNVSAADKLIGALGVGPWPESGLLQNAVNSEQKLTDRMQKRFEETGTLWGNESLRPVGEWDDTAIICNCMQVAKSRITACIAAGAVRAEQITTETGAGSVCGSCQSLICQLAGETGNIAHPAYRTLLVASIGALLLVTITSFFPQITFAQSVTDGWYKIDRLWRDPWIKKITGFSLLGICLIGLLFSLRKRFAWFRWGQFTQWRAFHAIFGVTSLVALFVHTGFRFGHNLNFWLMLTFVLLNLLGALAGVIAALESRGVGIAAEYARQWRPAMTRLHIILFWPFPILLAFHILSTLFY